MGTWDKYKEFDEVARPMYGHQFSSVFKSFDKAKWYEFNKFEVIAFFEAQNSEVNETHLGHLSERGIANTSFLPLDLSNYFF